MHAKPGLRVLFEVSIIGSGSVIFGVIPLSQAMKTEIKILIVISLGLSILALLFARLESRFRTVTGLSEYVAAFGPCESHRTRIESTVEIFKHQASL